MPRFTIHANQFELLRDALAVYGFDDTRFRPSIYIDQYSGLRHIECNLEGTDFYVKVNRHETTHPSRFVHEPREELHQLVYVRSSGDSIVLASTQIENNNIQSSTVHFDAFPNLPEYLIGHASKPVPNPIPVIQPIRNSGLSSLSLFSNPGHNESQAFQSDFADFGNQIERIASDMQSIALRSSGSLRRSASNIPVARTHDIFAVERTKPVYKTLPEAKMPNGKSQENVFNSEIRDAQQRFESVYQSIYEEECRNPLFGLFVIDEVKIATGLNHYIRIALTDSASKCYKTLVKLDWLSGSNPNTPQCVKEMIRSFQDRKADKSNLTTPSNHQKSVSNPGVLTSIGNVLRGFR